LSGDIPYYIVVEVLDINIYDDPNIKNVHIAIITLMLSHHYLIMQWSPRDALPSPISSAVYTSDGLMVYAGFRDGAIGIFEAKSLRLRCRIAPSAYIPSSISRYVPSPTVSVESTISYWYYLLVASLYPAEVKSCILWLFLRIPG
jgi:hypothetical protein